MAKIDKINIASYFAESESLLEREADINTLLLQLTITVNAIVDWISESEKLSNLKHR